jgi:hypothetical protein
MSSIFDLPERLQRLRQMFTYFRNAALLTGVEVRDSVDAGSGEIAHEEWVRLLTDVNDCLLAAQALVGGTGGPAAAPSVASLTNDDAHRTLLANASAQTVH